MGQVSRVARVLSENEFWLAVFGGGKRALVCAPDYVEQYQTYVRERQLEDVLIVVGSSAIEDDRLLVLSVEGLEAAAQQLWRDTRGRY